MKLYFHPRSFLLAVVTSAGSILVLLYGLGIGSQVVTGAVLAGSISALLMIGDRSRFIVTEIDVLFVAFLLCIAISLAINGWPDSPKDMALLVVSLAAYPAGRTMPRGKIGVAFVGFSAVVVVAGGAVTARALIEQWNEPYVNRPEVFGYYHAASVFLFSLGFILIALTSGPWLTGIRTKIACAVCIVPAFIFGLSLVRFGFAAIATALAAVAATSGLADRRRVYAVIAVTVLAGAAGFLTRSRNLIEIVGTYPALAAAPITTGVASVTPAENGRVRCGVDIDSSIAIRTVLLKDAVGKIRDAGWFGIGFTNFSKVTCFQGTTPHNSILQAVVEIGWLGGTVLTLLVLSTALHAWSAAKGGSEARFVFGCLVYVVTIGFAHGSLGQDMLLFLFMGYAGRVYQDGFY